MAAQILSLLSFIVNLTKPKLGKEDRTAIEELSRSD